MASKSPQPGPPPVAPNDIGTKVLNALESFNDNTRSMLKEIESIRSEVKRLGETSRADSDKLSKEVTDLRLEVKGIDTTLNSIKDSLGSYNGKIELLAEKASDMKANITAVQVKANLNILGHCIQVLVVITSFLTIISAVNNLSNTLNRDGAGMSPSAPSSLAPSVNPPPSP